jgi:amino acid adenylation domain-containing protein
MTAMIQTLNRDDRDDLLKRSLATIRDLRARVRQLEQRVNEPVAIVGLACRLPGANDDPASLWRFLLRGGDAICTAPAGRWPRDHGARSADYQAAFLSDPAAFDAGVFGISPREAESLDPQQRLFLEVSWEALENSGQRFSALEGSPTGVFVGITNYDYCTRMLQEIEPAELDSYCLTSNASTFASGRLSYILGLRGPSLSVDTACSSSLVSVHLACQSLRSGECTMALAGGVNVLLSPEWFHVLTKAGMMSPEARCKTFDASADGYVRGEGCVVFVLKRLSDALSDRDHIHGLLRGSSVNQDGRSAGVTVPNADAQQAVIRAALQSAGALPEDVSYVEAHGTGTPLGDPIEVRALGRVLCADGAREEALRIGSIKANLGHLEPAAGALGLLKVVLGLSHEELPPQVGLRQINPEIDLNELGIAIHTERNAWPRTDKPRVAGVSSFGASGTNAHVVVQEAPHVKRAPDAPRRSVQLFTLSARSPDGLLAQSTRHAAHCLAHPEQRMLDVCRTIHARAHMPERLAVPAASADELHAALSAFSAGKSAAGLALGRARVGKQPKVAFLFTGQGSQYPGMGIELVDAEPVFRTALERCAAVLDPYLGRPLLALIRAEGQDHGRLDQTRFTQPVLFSVEYALACLWRSWGIEPDAVLGHSVGEYVAACVAGAASLEDCLLLIARRGALMQERSRPGAMAAVFAPLALVESCLIPGEPVSIAALNGPDSLVLSGAEQPLAAALDRLASHGCKFRRLNVSQGFHSALLDPMLDALQEQADNVMWKTPEIPVISNLTGRPLAPGELSGHYLRRHAREPVQFQRGMDWLLEHDFDTFLEVGPAPHLISTAQRFVAAQDRLFLPSLRAGREAARTLLESLASLYVRGAAIDWEQHDADEAARVVPLPTYAFERKHYWYTPRATRPAASVAPAGLLAQSLLGSVLASSPEAVEFEASYDPAQHPCLGDCVMDGMHVVNVGVYLDAALELSQQTLPASPHYELRQLSIRRGFVLDPLQPPRVRSAARLADAEGCWHFSLHSRDEQGSSRLHAEADLVRSATALGQIDPATVVDARAEVTSGESFYAQLAARKLALGPSARWIESVRHTEGAALARMRSPRPEERADYRVHPGLVDAAFQNLFACLPAHVPADAIFMIVEVERIVWRASSPTPAFCFARVRSGTDVSQLVVADVMLTDEHGHICLQLEGALLKRTTPAHLQQAALAAPVRATCAEDQDTRQALRALPPERRTPEITRWLAERAAAVMRCEVVDLDPELPLASAGFDSLMAVELKNVVARDLGVSLSLSSLFVEATLSKLGGQLSRAFDSSESLSLVATAESSSDAPRVTATPGSDSERYAPFDLTDLQQAYLFGRTSSFELGGVSTYFFLEVDLTGVDIARLQTSLRFLIDRHDMLRAVITPDGQQRVLAAVPPYQIRTTDLSTASAEEEQRALAEIHATMAQQVFPTGRFPLFDVRATRLREERTRLHLGFDALIIDAWSTALLFREWAAVYRHGPSALQPMELTFRDYVQRLNAEAESPSYARAAAYWRARVPNLPPAPALPLAKSPATVTAARFAHRSFRLDPTQWDTFRARAQRAGVTPSSVLCCLYAEVLAAWSNSRSFTLNVLFFNRRPLHAHVDRVLGNFSATTLLQIELRTGEDMPTRAQRLQAQLWSDLDHADFSGVQVLRELNKLNGDARRARMPVVFASTINFHKREGEAPSGLAQHLLSLGQEGKRVHSSIRTPQVWLDHQVVEDESGLALNWDVVEELFPEGMVDAMFAAYEKLVRRLAESEQAWYERDRNLVPEAQLQQRDSINATCLPAPEGLLHDPFLRQVARQPDRAAVLSTRRNLSYAELNAASNRVANWLRAGGVRPNELVGVLMHKGWEQVVAVLGALKAHATYVPLDAQLPEERRAHLLQQTDIKYVLTQSWVELGDAMSELTVLAVDAMGDLRLSAAEPPPSPRAASDLAYVIFTSGSTGVPKGVMVEHGSALNTVLDVNERFGIDADSRVLALSALNFDLSVWDIFGILAAGGALVVPDADGMREPSHWLTLMEREQVNVWNTVPALMEMLVDYIAEPEDALRRLRVVMMSGDWIPVSLPGRIRRAAPNAALYSMGGATEAAIWSIVYPIDEVPETWTSIPYGKAMRNQQMLVLDETLAPCPVWVPGQIYIGGIGLARGYFKDPEKTAKSFIVDPKTGARLYRTGDLGRFLPSGDIEFLGREDSQVKVQGFRIELGEVEAALTQHPNVTAAVASAVGQQRGAKRLIAHVILTSPGAVSGDELRAFAASKLPAYAVPQAIMVIASIPLSANGKVNRAALPRMDAPDAHPAASAAPETELEVALVPMWSELLGGPVGVDQSFFDCGGTSLTAVRLMARIRRDFGCELAIATLFESPTIRTLAARILAAQQRPSAARGNALVPIREGGSLAPFFCVHPVGGGVMCYADLARALGEERPFYGLQADASSGDDNIEKMASSYLAALRSVQAHGPYHLGGWSMGGAVAYEMAHQLRAAGEEVALVALIDVAEPPHASAELPDRNALDDADLLAWFAADVAAVAGRALRVPADSLRAVSEEAALAHVLHELQRVGAPLGDLSLPSFAAMVALFKRNLRALFAYRAPRCPGPLWFCRGKWAGAASSTTAQAWLNLAERSRLVEVDADHYGLMSSSVATVAQRLREALLEV